MSRKWFLLVLGAAALLLIVLATLFTSRTIPTSNTNLDHFDTVIVLGWPARSDGKPSQMQRAGVEAGLKELKAGRVDHILMTGGAAHNPFVEADVMARLAEDAGVDSRKIVVESKARNTIENMYYSNLIMREHGWNSAEIVTSASHVPRASLILAHYPFAWKTLAFAWPPRMKRRQIWLGYVHEIAGTSALRWFGFRHSPFLPARSLIYQAETSLGPGMSS